MNLGKEDRATKNNGKTRDNETWKNTGPRAGEETDRATWSRKIISHTDDRR